MRWNPTAIEVSWDMHVSAALIAGYQVYYNSYAIPQMDKWQSLEIGPYTMTVINGIEQHTVYAVKVRAKSVDGRFGKFSKVVTTKFLPQGNDLHYNVITCPVLFLQNGKNNNMSFARGFAGLPPPPPGEFY